MSESQKKLPLLCVCDDDQEIHAFLEATLCDKYRYLGVSSAQELLKVVRNSPIDAVLLDLHLTSENEGLKLITRIREIDPDLPIVMLSADTDYSIVRTALQLGASDYLSKQIFLKSEEIHRSIERVLERKKLLTRNSQINFEVARIETQQVLVGRSPVIERLRSTLTKFQKSQGNVIIHGETGTGKEIVARHLRGNSPDGGLKPFVTIDSATIMATTAESILFGHEKGAFTGADKPKKGLFEEANEGVIYFDEISNMPLEIQAKLLRVIQEKEVRRLGSAKLVPLDFRVIAATNKDLELLIKEGKFKDDLYQRLNVLPIYIAPLRERREDIPLLMDHFRMKSMPQGGPFEYSRQALDALMHYAWPGNVRELGNVVAYILAMNEGAPVEFEDLPPRIQSSRGCQADTAKTYDTGTPHGNLERNPEIVPGLKTENIQFYDMVKQFEKETLAKIYQHSDKSIKQLALELGMDKAHLYRKLREYGITSKDAKS